MEKLRNGNLNSSVKAIRYTDHEHNSVDLCKTTIELIRLSINKCNIERMMAWEKDHNIDMTVYDRKIAELKQKKSEIERLLLNEQLPCVSIEITYPSAAAS